MYKKGDLQFPSFIRVLTCFNLQEDGGRLINDGWLMVDLLLPSLKCFHRCRSFTERVFPWVFLISLYVYPKVKTIIFVA
jgi:hypothetical protein